MKKKRQVYEQYNHRIIWSAAERCIKQADSDLHSAHQFNLCAMTMMYFAFEGYINWLGEILLPEVWKTERQFFNRDPYTGTIGKLKLIARGLHVSEWNEKSVPLSTIIGLQSLRHKVAHSKSERGERDVDYTFSEPPPAYIGSLDELVTPESTKQVQTDIELVANRLHDECHKHFPDKFPTAKPFCGLLGGSRTEI